MINRRQATIDVDQLKHCKLNHQGVALYLFETLKQRTRKNIFGQIVPACCTPFMLI